MTKDKVVNTKVFHIVAGTWKNHGGPSEVIPELVGAQRSSGLDARLLTLDGNQSQAAMNLASDTGSVEVYKWYSSLRVAPVLLIRLLFSSRRTILHVHGCWLFPNWVAFAVAAIKKQKLVLSPHGVLTKDMIRTKTWKKKLSFFMFESWAVKRSTIHFLSDFERSSSHFWVDVGSVNSVVISNGVSKSDTKNLSRSKPNRIRKCLFFSRISRVKGILELLKAWKDVSDELGGVHLDIFGPVDQDIGAEFHDLIKKLNGAEYRGGVYGAERFDVMAGYDALLLPTKAEGYPTVVLEAGAVGLPVITTIESNVDDLISRKLVSIVSINNLAQDLVQVLVNPSVLYERSHRLQKFILEEKQWSTIAKVWKRFYEGSLC